VFADFFMLLYRPMCGQIPSYKKNQSLLNEALKKQTEVINKAPKPAFTPKYFRLKV